MFTVQAEDVGSAFRKALEYLRENKIETDPKASLVLKNVTHFIKSDRMGSPRYFKFNFEVEVL